MSFTFSCTRWLFALGEQPPLRAVDYSLHVLTRQHRLDDLCDATLTRLRTAIRTPDDFLRASIQASRFNIIEDPKFRKWFTSFVCQSRDSLLKALDVDNDAARLCSILISALALEKDETNASSTTPARFRSLQDQLAPPTPPASGSKTFVNAVRLDWQQAEFEKGWEAAVETLATDGDVFEEDDIMFSHDGVDYRKRDFFVDGVLWLPSNREEVKYNTTHEKPSMRATVEDTLDEEEL